nr:hypothetical protein CFP56_12098 [Quercus suber]
MTIALLELQSAGYHTIVRLAGAFDYSAGVVRSLGTRFSRHEALSGLKSDESSAKSQRLVDLGQGTNATQFWTSQVVLPSKMIRSTAGSVAILSGVGATVAEYLCSSRERLGLGGLGTLGMWRLKVDIKPKVRSALHSGKTSVPRLLVLPFPTPSPERCMFLITVETSVSMKVYWVYGTVNVDMRSIDSSIRVSGTSDDAQDRCEPARLTVTSHAHY